MEITSSMIYWLTRLTYLQGFFIAMAIASGFIAVAQFPYDDIIGGKMTRKTVAKCIKVGLLCAFFSLVACLTPTTKEAAAIIVIPVIANNEQVQELPNKILELGNDWLEELKPKKPK